MKQHASRPGFTLIELLVVVAMISTFSSVVLAQLNSGRDKAFRARAIAELRTVAQALQIYILDNDNQFPADVSRNLPNGLEAYLGPGQWPAGPWPGSVYDWDNWSPSALADNPKEQIYQISVRFCPQGGPLSACNFPEESWVNGSWGVNSAVYYCIQGPCRSHSSELITYPGYCVNCN